MLTNPFYPAFDEYSTDINIRIIKYTLRLLQCHQETPLPVHLELESV
jgi:hypothetical protein